MRRSASLAVLVWAALAAPAAAQASCIVIPSGAGEAAVHCQDGRVGHLLATPGGFVSGMIGGQMVVGSPESLSPPMLDSGDLAPRLLNPDGLSRATPLAPPSFAPPVPPPALSDPAAVPPWPEAAGSRPRPGD